MPPAWDRVDLGLTDLDNQNPEEQMGSKAKNWVRLPGDDRPWLVKQARVDARDGTVSGEDWAEWLVHHLAGLIGVPTASVRPATFRGHRAVVSRSVLTKDSQRLVHGNELLSARFPAYDQRLRGNNPGYTVRAVHSALYGISAPVDVGELTAFSAFDVWAGYLMLDAWVSGRDRHQENWAVIRTDDARRLSPSFDHGNALGFQERDERRARMLSDREHLIRWLSRGTSSHFAGRPHLIDLAQSAVGLAADGARRHWYARLDAVDVRAMEETIQAVPQDLMSDVGRSFVSTVLHANRGRLLHGYSAS